MKTKNGNTIQLLFIFTHFVDMSLHGMSGGASQDIIVSLEQPCEAFKGLSFDEFNIIVNRLGITSKDTSRNGTALENYMKEKKDGTKKKK